MAEKRIIIFGWAHSVHVQRWVRGLTQRGYEVKVVSLGGEPLDGIETCILPRHSKGSYLCHASQAAREARAFKPHLVHVHYAAGFGLWGLRLRFTPTIVSVWGADIMDFPSNRLFRALIKRVLHQATHITATSNLLKKVVLQLTPDSDRKITVIPFGVIVPPEIVRPPLSPPVKVCFLKTHRPKYGPDILLRALAQVKEVVPEITLSIAGEGGLTQRLKQMTSELNLGENVRFVGFVPNPEVYTFLRQHHIMVMPSVMDSESFGVAALEASACGRPVIASNVGGVPEVVLDGTTGILVPPKDPDKLAKAIIKLAQDVEVREKMGRAGYEFVKQRYSWERSLDMMCDLYERLINEKLSR